MTIFPSLTAISEIYVLSWAHDNTYISDIAVKDGKIVKLGNLSEENANQIIDLTSLHLLPSLTIFPSLTAISEINVLSWVTIDDPL